MFTRDIKARRAASSDPVAEQYMKGRDQWIGVRDVRGRLFYFNFRRNESVLAGGSSSAGYASRLPRLPVGLPCGNTPMKPAATPVPLLACLVVAGAMDPSALEAALPEIDPYNNSMYLPLGDFIRSRQAADHLYNGETFQVGAPAAAHSQFRRP